MISHLFVFMISFVFMKLDMNRLVILRIDIKNVTFFTSSLQLDLKCDIKIFVNLISITEISNRVIFFYIWYL